MLSADDVYLKPEVLLDFLSSRNKDDMVWIRVTHICSFCSIHTLYVAAGIRQDVEITLCMISNTFSCIHISRGKKIHRFLNLDVIYVTTTFINLIKSDRNYNYFVLSMSMSFPVISNRYVQTFAYIDKPKSNHITCTTQDRLKCNYCYINIRGCKFCCMLLSLAGVSYHSCSLFRRYMATACSLLTILPIVCWTVNLTVSEVPGWSSLARCSKVTIYGLQILNWLFRPYILAPL